MALKKVCVNRNEKRKEATIRSISLKAYKNMSGTLLFGPGIEELGDCKEALS